jgi:anti-sigma factor RsiW
MPTTKPPIEPRLSESDVQAFADGMLDPQRAASVEAYLKSRPDEAKRVAFYGRLNWQMQNTFHEPDNEPGDETAPQAPAPGRRMSSRSLRALLIAAVVTVAVAAAAIFAFDISDSALDNASMMALEQAVASQEMASGAVGYESSVRALASAPDLSSVGFQPVARRKMPVGPFASAMEYVYRNRGGEAAVLLVAPALFAQSQTQWKAHRVGASRLLAWTAHGKRYVLAGRAKTRGLMLAADLMTGS